MDPDGLWKIAVLIVLLSFSAFFSASETALTSISKIRIKHMQKEGIKGADIVSRLKENPSRMLGTILVGNNAVNIGASALATALAIELFQNKGVGIATGVMTILILVFSEITPKSLAAHNSEKISLKVAKPLSFIIKILNPIVIVFNYITNGLIKLFGGSITSKQPVITEEELKTIVNVSQEEGILEAEEKRMINNVFDFGDLQIRNIMLPRTDIVALDIDTSYEQFIEIMKDTQFSRYPVYKGRIDNIIGVLYVKDILFLNINKENFKLENFIREAHYTYESKKISDAFNDMKKKRIHMLIVLDEYGGTAGIVTIEDLIEQIVGDIVDEYDDHEIGIQVIKDNEFLVDGGTRIDVVNDEIGLTLESENFDTIGGFILGELDRLPQQGDKIEYNGASIIVEKIDRNRIRSVRVRK